MIDCSCNNLKTLKTSNGKSIIDHKINLNIFFEENPKLDLLNIPFNYCIIENKKKEEFTDKERNVLVLKFKKLSFDFTYSEEVIVNNKLLTITKLTDDYYQLTVGLYKVNYIDQFSALLKFLKKFESLL